MDYIQKTGAGISIDQFNCWGDWSLNRAFNAGEYKIFDLPDLKSYDGIIVDINNITHPETLDRLLSRIRESHLPAVSLCSDVPGLYYAGINGRKAVTQMITHLYKEHGCRSFFFAGGPEGNYENEERAAAFHDAMIALGLPQYADSMVYSDFDASGGHQCMRYLLEHHIPIPDAIVCANDNIAVGLIGEAEQHGYKVPRDFRVTGFDYFDKAAWFEPQLTTAVLHREAIGALAVQVMEKCWAKEDCPHYNYTDARIIFTESCGCPNSGVIDYRSYVRGQVLGIITTQDNDAAIARLESDLAAAEHTEAFAQQIADQYGSMDCDGCVVYLDQRVLDPEEDTFRSPSVTAHFAFDPARCCAAAAAGKSVPFLAGESIAAHLQCSPSKDTKGSVWYYMPLHIDDSLVGCVALFNPRFLVVHFDIFEIQEAILFILKSQFQNAQLKNALATLQKIYNRDTLTGVYNRTALDEILMPVYEQWIAAHREVAVIFADLDHFKEINDTYSHARGDEMLCFVAHAMQRHLPDSGFLCRYGGDEFLAVFPIESAEDVRDYLQKVEADAAGEGVSISAGVCQSSGGTLEEKVQEADREMYRVKELHHARTGR